MGLFTPWHLILLLFVLLLPVAFLVAVIAVIAAAVNSSKKKADTALNIVKERYARGEIDEQEFRQKKQDLSD